MADTNERNVIGIDGLDRPIYRIYSRDRVLDLLRKGEDGLRNPSTWDDPFENFLLERTLVATGAPGELADLKSLAAAWYGQCWTMNCDTDAMWRIYSPRKDGVQARTTVRKLFDNLRRVPAWSPRAQFFVGAVTYRDEAGIVSLMNGLTFTAMISGGQGDRFAELLCVKREAFEHECEVRILYQDVSGQPGLRCAGRTATYALDPNAIFDGLVLDPRLRPTDAKVLEGELRTAGWRGSVGRSTLYDVPSFVIPVA